MPAERTHVKISSVDALGVALEAARRALAEAPNPRVVDGPPAFWQWYDGARTHALKQLEALQQ